MNCKICNSESSILYDRQFDINYYHCKNCDFIFIHPDCLVSKQEELRIYEQHNNSLNNASYVAMLKGFIDRAVTPYSLNTKNILDFGSGPQPILAHLLKEKGYEVDIYDLYYSPEKIYLDRVYDLITITEVIEHLQNPVEILETLYKRLKPSGIMAITTLYHPNDSELFQNWWYRRDKTHISFYSHDTMKYLANKFKMKILLLEPKNLCVLQK